MCKVFCIVLLLFCLRRSYKSVQQRCQDWTTLQTCVIHRKSVESGMSCQSTPTSRSAKTQTLFSNCWNIYTLLQRPFFSGTIRVSWYQKGKSIWILLKQDNSQWQLHQLGRMQICISLQADNHASTPTLIFYRPDALPAAQSIASKHWMQ